MPAVNRLATGILFVILAGLASALATGVSPGPAETAGPWQAACAAYQQGKYAEAQRGFEQLLADGMVSARLCYNLGNAYYQQGAKGRAAWMYEKALALEPRNADARKNLRLARPASAVAESDAFFLFRPVGWLASRLTAGEWGFLLLLASNAAALGAAGWILLRPGRLRRLCRGATLALCLGSLCLAGFYLPRRADAEWNRYGVVVQGGSVVRNAPGEQGGKYFEAPEGERLQVWESGMRGWLRVKQPSTGREGFLPDAAVGRL